MHEEYTNLLALVGVQVGGVFSAVSVEDYKALILLARQHSVLNILYYALKDDPNLPPECRAVLESRLFSSAQQQLEQERETARIKSALDGAGIRHLLMKGALIRALYPAPEMRTSCDVDFYYDKAARPQMDALFASLGYEKEETDPNHTAYKTARNTNYGTYTGSNGCSCYSCYFCRCDTCRKSTACTTDNRTRKNAHIL